MGALITSPFFNRNDSTNVLDTLMRRVQKIQPFLDIANILFENALNVDKQLLLEYRLHRFHEDLDVIDWLMKNGADANLPNGNGFTPLHQAVHDGYYKTVRVMARNRASINSLDR